MHNENNRSGIATELLSSAQMRAIEHAAIKSGEVNGLELMERAGQGVVEAIYKEWPEFGVDELDGWRVDDVGEGGVAPRTASSPQSISGTLKAVVLCGPGNNGGDGFVVARLLRARGWEVEVLFSGEVEKLPPDARVNYERWCGLGVVRPLSFATFRDYGGGARSGYADVYIDAVFGTGLSRPVSGETYAVLDDLWGRNGDRYSGRTVAVDVPSGFCLDSGRFLRSDVGGPSGGALAALTVTFDSPKIGHYIGAGPEVCGRLVVKDIGVEDFRVYRVPRRVDGRTGGAMRLPDTRLVGAVASEEVRRAYLELPLGVLNKAARGHKFNDGHALVLSGGPGCTGAGRLAARAALRVGAGLVSLGVPPAAQQEAAAQLAAIMVQRVGDARAFKKALEDPRITALCLGPALGLDEAAAAKVMVALKSDRPVVLDADALTLLAREHVIFEALHPKCILTPHAGEFARLFPDIADRLAAVPRTGPAYSKVDATQDAAARAGCTVLFKGPDTVIAGLDGRRAIHSAQYARAAPWLATAGSGDVLAGMIVGLLARGVRPMQAAEIAAWMHVECALEFGPGLIAEDLPEQIPAVLRRLP